MQKRYSLTVTFFLFILFPIKGLFAQNPASPYIAPVYSFGCASSSSEGAVTYDVINNFYTTGGIENIQNYFSGCNSATLSATGGSYNYTLFPPVSNRVLKVTRGQQFRVHAGAGVSYAQGIRVWIDWNKDYSYNNNSSLITNGELVFSSTSATMSTGASIADSVVLHSNLITVPQTATCGWTRLRVRCVFSNSNFTSTDFYSYGETEEYYVFVMPNPVLSLPSISDSILVACPGSNVTVNASSSGTISWYNSLVNPNQLVQTSTNIITPNSFTFLGLLRDTSIFLSNIQSGCQSERVEVKLKIEQLRDIDILTPDTSICIDEQMNITSEVNPTLPIFKTYYSAAYTAIQITQFANRIPDDYIYSHPFSFLTNTISVRGMNHQILQANSIEEVGIRINSKRLKDIDVWLVSPSGNEIELTTDNGSNILYNTAIATYGSGSTSNIQYCVFKTNALQSVTNINTSAIIGNYKPEQLFSNLSGNINGDWTLRIGDDKKDTTMQSDGASLTGWFIKFRRESSDTVFVWSPTANISSFDSLNVLVHPLNTTTYKLELSNSIGCITSDSVVISVHGLQVSINGNTYLCNETNSSLSANPVFASYLWSDGSTTNSIIANAPSTYSIQVTDTFGCNSSDTVTVIQYNAGLAVLDLNGSLSASIDNAAYQWFDCNSNSIIPNETGQVFNTSIAGNYSVIVTQNGCVDTSACYPLIFTSLTNQSEERPFTLYPNPANNKINMSGITNQNLEIQNTLGQTIFSIQNCNAFETIDVSGFAKGVYFVRVDNASLKFIKQ